MLYGLASATKCHGPSGLDACSNCALPIQLTCTSVPCSAMEICEHCAIPFKGNTADRKQHRKARRTCKCLPNARWDVNKPSPFFVLPLVRGRRSTREEQTLQTGRFSHNNAQCVTV